MKNLKCIAVALFIFCFPNYLLTNLFAFSFAEPNNINVINTAVPFLNLATDARGSSMGYAGVSSTPDLYSVHWNPSKYAFLNDKTFTDKDEKNNHHIESKSSFWGIAASTTPWKNKNKNIFFLNHFIGLWRPDNKHAIALSFRHFNHNNSQIFDEARNVMGVNNPKEFSIDIAYARKLGKFISGGVALRYIHSNMGFNFINSSVAQAFAADISVYYEKRLNWNITPATFSAGVNISNIGDIIVYGDFSSSFMPDEKQRKNFIPINLRLGPSIVFEIYDFHNLSFTVDFNKLLVPSPPVYARDNNGMIIIDENNNYVIEKGRNPFRPMASRIFGSFSDAPDGFIEELNEISIAAGTEFVYNKLYALRAGYFYEHEAKGNRKYLTFGFGINYRIVKLDICYLSRMHKLINPDNALKLSVGIIF